MGINVDASDSIFGKLHVKGGTDANFLFTTASSEASLELFSDAGSANVPLNVRASEYKVKIGSSEKLRINSSGNVGIGTSSPGAPLSVQSASDTEAIEILGRAADDIGTFSFFENDGTTEIGRIQARTTELSLRARQSGQSILFITNGTAERARINSSGNLGVGTSSPGQLLHLNSSASTAIQISDGTNNQFISSIKTAGNFANGSTAGDVLIRGQNGFAVSPNNGSSVALRIDNSGNVLVGTTDSTIYNNGDSDSEGIVLRDGEVIDIARKGDLQLTLNRQTNDGHHIGFFRSGSPKSYIATRSGGFCIDVNSSERLRIDSSGRVLLGTTTEGAALADNLTVADSGNSGITIRSGAANYGSIYFSDGDSGGAGEYSGFVEYNHNGDYLGFGTGSTTRARIDSSGNVGINNSSPGSYNSDGRNLVVGSGSGGQGLSIASGTSNYGTIYFADGTSGDALYRGAILYNHASDFMRFDTAAGERMRLDSSGRLLLGTTTEGLADGDNLTIADSGACGITLRSGSSSGGAIYFSDATSGSGEYAGFVEYLHSSNALRFASGGTERMRLDSSGSLGLGTDSPSTLLDVRGEISVAYNANYGLRFYNQDRNNWSSIGNNIVSGTSAANLVFKDSTGEVMRLAGGNVLVAVTNTTKTSEGFRIENGGQPNITRGTDGTFILFYHTSGSVIGSIQNNGGTGTLFSTSSDYRLKENVVGITDGITRVKQLSPKRFNFIINADKTVDGFLAHEAQTVVPEAVTGEKDGEEMQGIDQSKLVPLLTAALQEAIAKIETLETKVAALEAG